MEFENIGKRLAKLRKEKGKSQAEMAADLFTTRNTVAKWETGAQDLKSDSVIKLSKYFGVSCDELLTGNRPEHAELASSLGLTSESIDSLKRLVRCTNSDNWTDEEKKYYEQICTEKDKDTDTDTEEIDFSDICISYGKALYAVNFILGHEDCQFALCNLGEYLECLRMIEGHAVFDELMRKTKTSAGINPFSPSTPYETAYLFSFIRQLNVWAEQTKSYLSHVKE